MIYLPEQAVAAAREWRERIHALPELGYAEHRTAGAIAAYLRSIGWQVETGLAGTGLLARLAGTKAGPRILLRAELDALPIQEESGLPFASTVAGVSHACGHDAHLGILLGLATALVPGTMEHGDIGLVFQPAEELLGGGRRLIEEGLWPRFNADCCLALHGLPALPPGVFGLVPGPCMAAVDKCRIRVIGRPGHAAAPHETVDPIVVSAELVLSLQTILSRSLNPTDPAVLTFGRIAGGTAENAVAGTVTLEGTLRYFDRRVGERLADGIRTRAAGVTAAYGAQAEVTIEDGYPATCNDPGMVRWLEDLITAEFGPEAAGRMEPLMVSEDFAYYLNERPGAMVFIGTGSPFPLHNPSYFFPDELLGRGIRLYLAAITQMAQSATLPWL